MLNIEVTKEHTKIEIAGNLPNICSDLTNVMHGIVEKLEEIDVKLAKDFKVMFTKGFMEGVVFGEDREHMEHYLAIGDGAEEKKKTLQENVDDFLSFLNGKLEELKKFNGSEDEDEAK